MRGRSFFLSLLLLLGLAARDGATGVQYSDVAGIYRLVLPESGTMALRLDRGGTVPSTVESGKLDLQPVWHFQIDYRADPPGIGYSGSYERTKTGIILDYDRGFMEVGTFEGDDLVITSRFGEAVRVRKVPQAR